MDNTKNMQRAADIITDAHFVWIGLVVASLPLMFLHPRYRNLAVALIVTTVGSWKIFGDCPLFLLENRLRPRGEKYKGSFMAHYSEKYFSLRIPSAFFTVAGYTYGALIIVFGFVLNQRSNRVRLEESYQKGGGAP